MSTKNHAKLARPVLAVLLFLAASVQAATAVELRFEPALQNLDPGQAGSVSLVIDDDLPLRTAEITLTGDPQVITNMVCEPGALFGAVPCMLWEESEELEPGTWHGFVVIIGSSCQTAGAGELLRWRFTAGAEGWTNLVNIQALLYAPNGALIDTVTVSGPATVIVGNGGPSAVPPAVGTDTLHLAPNPFNPRTAVSGELAVPGSARVTVHDLRGGLVAVLHDGILQAGPFSLPWDGRDRSGRSVSGGVYLFRLDTGTGAAATRGLLLK